MTRDTFDNFQDKPRGRFGDNEAADAVERPKGNSRLHDLAMTLHLERPAAVLVSSTGDITRAVWLPKSQIEIELTGGIERKRGGKTIQSCCITLPEWLAKDKGLL